MKLTCVAILLFCGTVIAITAEAAAQKPPVLAIKIHTEAGVAIPGATIHVRRDEGFDLAGITGEDGKLAIETLARGNYTIHITADGFQDSFLPISVVDARQTIETDVTLVPEIRRSDTIDVVADDTSSVAATSSKAAVELRPGDMPPLPTVPATVTDILTLDPGVIRAPGNQIQIAGQGEQRSALLVNSNTSSDPATGQFGVTIPVDSVESVRVLQTPFLAEYGGFTSGLVAVQTRRGGEKWHFGLREFIPDFRVRSGHIRGLRDSTPRLSFNGPLVRDKLFLSQSLQYDLEKKQTRTLSFPYNESKDELLNSFSQLDYIVSPNHFITTTLHLTPHRIDFVNPQFFSPQPVTPSFKGNERSFNLTEHAVVHRALLDTSVTQQQFRADIGAQGEADMILAPLGNSGNYFARRGRLSSRTEWLETLSASRGSTHAFKAGSVLTMARNQGHFDFRRVEILNSTGNKIETIDFTSGQPFTKSDTELGFFVQDHWSATPRISMDVGTRLEHQSTASALRLAPRIGVAWTPFAHDPALVRTGYGVFYDRVPLSVYSFPYRPEQTMTVYDPLTGFAKSSSHLSNVLTSDSSDAFPLVRRGTSPGNFAPFSQTWMVGMERPVWRLMRIQVNYRHSDSGGQILLTPGIQNGANARVLGAGGHSSYRQLEITSTMSWRGGQQLLLSYVRSKTRGDVNIFSNYIGDYPDIPLRPNYYSNAPGDIPNRFLAWGVVNLPWKTRIVPVFEFHTGQPFAILDEYRNYVGMPYSDQTRFRDYVNFDERVSKDIRVISKYSVRLSLSVLNVLNHFNPLDVHANTADPLIGTFFGHYKRRYRADFEFLF